MKMSYIKKLDLSIKISEHCDFVILYKDIQNDKVFVWYFQKVYISLN